MPGPPSAEVLNAQPRKAGKGAGQPPAKKGHGGMCPPGAPAGSESRAEDGERGWLLPRGAGQGTQRPGAFPIAGGSGGGGCPAG